MKRVKLSGNVFTGRGEGEKFLELQWVKQQVMAKLGFTPFHGTLNVRLSEESAKRRKTLEEAASMKVCPAEGYCVGRIFHASIGKFACAVIIPEVPGYPTDVLEIIAPCNLREKLMLVDGDEVTVLVNL